MAAPASPSWVDQPDGSNSFRTTFPAGLRGIFFTNLMSRGCSKRDTLPFRNSLMDSSLDCGTVLRHDERREPLSVLLVRHPDHRVVGHLRQFGQRVLHRSGVDVLAARDDHVVGPPDDEQPARSVQIPDRPCPSCRRRHPSSRRSHEQPPVTSLDRPSCRRRRGFAPHTQPPACRPSPAPRGDPPGSQAPRYRPPKSRRRCR